MTCNVFGGTLNLTLSYPIICEVEKPVVKTVITFWPITAMTHFVQQCLACVQFTRIVVVINDHLFFTFSIYIVVNFKWLLVFSVCCLRVWRVQFLSCRQNFSTWLWSCCCDKTQIVGSLQHVPFVMLFSHCRCFFNYSYCLLVVWMLTNVAFCLSLVQVPCTLSAWVQPLLGMVTCSYWNSRISSVLAPQLLLASGIQIAGKWPDLLWIFF